MPENGHVDANEMEATVASLVFECAADSVVPGTSNLTGWVDFPDLLPDCAVHLGNGTYIFDASADQISNVASSGGLDPFTNAILLSVRNGFGVGVDKGVAAYNAFAAKSIQYGLRADSPGAPETYAEAISRGPPWPDAVAKEFSNHGSNESWDLINRSDVPRGRRIHRFVWVFKMKRDGTAKRACVFKGVHLKRASTTIRLLPNLCVMLPHVACLPTPRVIAARFAALTSSPHTSRVILSKVRLSIVSNRRARMLLEPMGGRWFAQ